MPQALQKQLDFIVADADHAAGRLYANIDLGMFGTFIWSLRPNSLALSG